MATEADPLAAEVQRLLSRWIDATVARDAQGYADLFVREPDPVVAWPSGEVTRGWKKVFEHAQREFYHAKAIVKRVEVHDLQAVPITHDTVEAVFFYDLEATDLWGATISARRLATATLVRTKDGLRFASAHYGHAPPADN